MSSITAIQVSVDDPNYREIYVDGEHVARVDAATLALLQFKVGSEWSIDQSAALNSRHEEQDARVMAMDLISRRMWGSKELRTRLIERGVQKKIAQQVMSSLLEDHWLDDGTYALALIQEWTRKEPAGEHLIRKKLLEKQVDREFADQAIANYISTNPPIDGAIACLKSRIQKAQLPLNDKSKNKIVNAVLRRGFTSEVVHDALKKALAEAT